MEKRDARTLNQETQYLLRKQYIRLRKKGMSNQLAAETVSMQASIYFAHPYRSWERGLNENSNGLLRQYFPKKYGVD